LDNRRLVTASPHHFLSSVAAGPAQKDTSPVNVFVGMKAGIFANDSAPHDWNNRWATGESISEELALATP